MRTDEHTSTSERTTLMTEVKKALRAYEESFRAEDFIEVGEWEVKIVRVILSGAIIESLQGVVTRYNLNYFISYYPAINNRAVVISIYKPETVYENFKTS